MLFRPHYEALENRLDAKQTQLPAQRCPRKNRPGAAVVEFAAVAPVFFMLVFGIIELGRALMVMSLLNQAARTACRKAIVGTLTSNSAIQDDVDTSLKNFGIKNSSATKNIYVGGSSGTSLSSSTASGTEIKVEIVVPVADITWVPGGSFLNKSLVGKYTSRME